MTWIDTVLMITFVIAFWGMVLALASSLFGGHRHQQMTGPPVDGITSRGSAIPESRARVTPPRVSDHDER